MECQLNGRFKQCCCNCSYHWQDNHHCTTAPPEIRRDADCVCSVRKGWACVVFKVTKGGPIYSGWPEHSIGCEMYTPKQGGRNG